MRRCGDCQLCCRLLPVRSIDKPGGVRCKHQKHGTGCAVYDKLPLISPECRLWNCAWLTDTAGDLRRPDHSHIVVDIMPDFVTITDNETGEVTNVMAVQVWIDPKYPDAHRDPALRAYLDERGRQDNYIALIRYGPKDGFVLFPPSMTNNGQWHEHHTEPNERTHTIAELIEAAHGKLDIAGLP